MFVKIKDDVFCESRLPWPKVKFCCQAFSEEQETTKLTATVYNKISKTNYLEWSADFRVKLSEDSDYQKAFDTTENALYSRYLSVTFCEHVFIPTNNNSLLECMGSGSCKKCSLVLDNYFMDKRTFDSMNLSKLAHIDDRRDFSGEPYFNHPKAVYCKVYSVFKEYKERPEIIDLFCACFNHDIKENCPHISSEEIIQASNQASFDVVLEVTNPSMGYPHLPREERIKMNCEHLENVSVLAKVVKMADRICNLKDLRLCKDIKWIAQYQKETELLIEHLENGLKKQKKDTHFLVYKEQISELMDELCFISNKVKHLAEHKENFFIEIPKDVEVG
jgi:guanosine-3',5'-bis(diphosphate) 3'-pyrophosphohydrolase